MERPYSQDLRSRMVAAVEAGASRNEAAQRTVSSKIKLMQRLSLTGSILPAPRGKKPYAFAERAATVRELVTGA
jgi:transposase